MQPVSLFALNDELGKCRGSGEDSVLLQRDNINCKGSMCARLNYGRYCAQYCFTLSLVCRELVGKIVSASDARFRSSAPIQIRCRQTAPTPLLNIWFAIITAESWGHTIWIEGKKPPRSTIPSRFS